MLRSVHAKRGSHSAATALAACLIALLDSPRINAETGACIRLLRAPAPGGQRVARQAALGAACAW